jgi:hypothetical protein
VSRANRISIVRGETLVRTVTVTDEDGEPIDITGAAVEFQVKAEPGDAFPTLIAKAVGSGIVISAQAGASLGQAVVTIPATETAALARGIYYYDVVAELGGVRRFVVDPERLIVQDPVNSYPDVPTPSVGPLSRYDIRPGMSAEEINELTAEYAFRGSRPLLCAPGVIELDAAVLLREHVSIQGSGRGRTIFVPDFAPAVGLADSPTNALFITDGAEAGWTTTLAVKAHVGALHLTPASTVGMQVGDWLMLEGSQASSEFLSSQGAEVIPRQRNRIAAINGGVVTLAWRTFHHARVGTAIKRITGPRGSALRHLSIDARGGSLAVGIALRYAQEVVLEQIEIGGFSRADIEVGMGTVGVHIRDVVRLGGSNALMICRGHNVRMTGVTTALDAQRFHQNGVKRALVWLNDDPHHVAVSDCQLARGGLGIAVHSGHGCSFSDIDLFDMEPDAAVDSLVAAGEHANPSPVGIVQGAGQPLGQIAFSMAVTWERITVDRSYANKADVYSFYWHDAFFATARTLKALNAGSVDDHPGGRNNLRGFLQRDTGGFVEDLTVRGLDYGYHVTGMFAAEVDGYTYASPDGNGVRAARPITLEMDSNDAVAPVMRRVRVGNSNEGIRFSFLSPYTRIEDVEILDGKFSDVTFLINNTGGTVQRHELVAVDVTNGVVAAGFGQFKIASGAAGELLAVVVTGTADFAGQGNPMAVAVLDAKQSVATVNVRAADAVRIGDKLVVDNAAVGGTTGKYLMVNNAPAAGIPYVIARQAKTAGAVAAILCEAA